MLSVKETDWDEADKMNRDVDDVHTFFVNLHNLQNALRYLAWVRVQIGLWSRLGLGLGLQLSLGSGLG